ncbi:polyphenol oxidase family protein [Klebsiella huaxiensis]|uniref:polyphenol oxidase family protein n=1 Tax=Klebsiella huaxiensis TaxID=2153354 RepID=UPI002F2F46FD
MSFTSRLLSDIPGIRYAFLDVHETAAFPYGEMAPVKLVHGNVVHHYQAPQAERPHADAMFTAVRGQKVGVVTADCLPLLMASRDGRYICSVHAGWRGAACGIIENSLALFRRYQVSPEELVVVSGPHIHPCCYEVSRDFYQMLLAMPAGELAKRDHESLFLSCQPSSDGEQAPATVSDNLWFDLQAFAHLLLRNAGVPDENMEWLGSCTYCTPQSLGSFRRRTHTPAEKSFQYSWIMRDPDSDVSMRRNDDC